MTVAEKTFALNEVWTPEIDWSVVGFEDEELSEAEKKVVDGKSVLGIVRGQFFVPNGVSRNKRKYPRTLWEEVLSRKDVMEKLQNGLMLGCIGHEDKAIDEKDISTGKTSHRVTKLFIDSSGKGMGEALILNTPAGRNLWTVLKSGSKLSVSSRGSGKLVEGRMNAGVPEVDKKSFHLETFDFVINPGFLEARPSLKENLNKLEDNLMSDLANGNHSVMNENLIVENKNLSENVADLRVENNDLVNKLKMMAEHYEKFDVLESLGDTDLHRLIDIVEAYGDTVMSELEELDRYREIGSPEQIMEALYRSKPIIEAWQNSSDPELLESELSIYRELGDPEEIVQVFEKYESILEQYDELGTPGDIHTAFELAEMVNENLSEVQEQEAIAELDEAVKYYSGQYGLSMEVTRSILERYSEDEAVELFENLEGKSSTSSFAEDFINENYDNDNDIPKYEKSVRKLTESYSGGSGATSVWNRMIKS
jgi:hypothetical protein